MNELEVQKLLTEERAKMKAYIDAAVMLMFGQLRRSFKEDNPFRLSDKEWKDRLEKFESLGKELR